MVDMEAAPEDKAESAGEIGDGNLSELYGIIQNDEKDQRQKSEGLVDESEIDQSEEIGFYDYEVEK